jgi:hypothetical protein
MHVCIFNQQEVLMKKGILLFVVLFAVIELMAQVKSQITIKNSEVTNGVVIVTAVEGRSPLELRCNKDASGCKTLATGDYWMVRLPKNWGMYDCTNVDIYPQTADPGAGEKIGQYCLIEQK